MIQPTVTEKKAKVLAILVKILVKKEVGGGGGLVVAEQRKA